ncbi:MAG: response regulator transcription factor [Haloarculaceae archaeon]
MTERTDGSSMNGTAEVASSTETERGQPVVLVVDDDDEDVADTYALWLEDGYDVRTAYSGHEALGSLTEDVDVVLLDRRMPNVPGDEVLRRIEERDLDVQVSMLTAVEPDSDLADLPFDEYLVKPVSKANVVDVVDELLLRDTLDEETQEYLALRSTADAIEAHADGAVSDPEAVAALDDQVEAARDSTTVEREVEKLQRLTAFNGLIRSVSQVIVEVDSRDALGREICAEFASEGSSPTGTPECSPRRTSTSPGGAPTART